MARFQVALGNEANRLITLFIERNDARPVGVLVRVAVHRVGGVKTVAGALLFILIPEIAALPDAMAQAGEGANDGGVVYHHILRIMAGSARLIRLYLYSILSYFAMLSRAQRI